MKSLIKKLAFALSIAAFSGASLNAAEEKNIVETAVSAGSFKTLTAALTAAGLVDALKGNGPFTVFAPTDEAFAKLPPGTVENLLKLKPENKAMLIDILTYHVVRGNVPSGTAIKLTEATALNNKKIKLEAKEGTLFLNTAKVTTADVKCSNGVIHIIDAVLMPPAGREVAPKEAMSDPNVSCMNSTLGVFVGAMSQAVQARQSLPEGVGVLVETVAADSLASKAGVMESDVIRAFNDQVVSSPCQFISLINQAQSLANAFGVASKVSLTIVRGGKDKVIDIFLKAYTK
ncbi:MAG: fasciclin domain-containing protein [Chthoniobacterales bacterium]